jgi:hypothetical protein
MKAIWAAIAFLSCLSLAFPAETNVPAKTISLVNAGAVSPEELAGLARSAEKSLGVSFETATMPRLDMTNLCALPSAVLAARKPSYAAVVILVASTGILQHAAFHTNEMVSVVNVSAMASTNATLRQSRLLKQVVRGTVFAMGIMPSKDPLCVSRDYSTLAQLDSMPAVLFPPWQSNFIKLAAKHGVKIVEKPKHRMVAKTAANP